MVLQDLREDERFLGKQPAVPQRKGVEVIAGVGAGDETAGGDGEEDKRRRRHCRR